MCTCAHARVGAKIKHGGVPSYMICDVDDLLANSLIEWIRFCYNELDIIL